MDRSPFSYSLIPIEDSESERGDDLLDPCQDGSDFTCDIEPLEVSGARFDILIKDVKQVAVAQPTEPGSGKLSTEINRTIPRKENSPELDFAQLEHCQSLIQPCETGEYGVKSPEKRIRISKAAATLEGGVKSREAETKVPSKWRCPRKGKPDKGPPLKQLRLERWVHRVI
ncbi:hypothetical protein QJS10_CPA01g02799 [Acorus calamus]|uniref:Uncharacterized protein n=1 Tax=Acorus calamus TaxID=4465 RepID=A0AAV9FM42_ACOCL|nr:hypothetical protein QJS10_CPA01g02799 [Acorus calamus]